MDRRLLQYYNRELQFIREMGGEFARAHPKIAGRLSLDAFACADPYVERLLEGFAFMAARVSLKLDSEFPRFTQAVLETVYPHYLATTPSMAVVRFDPDPRQASSLTEGVALPRGTAIRSQGAGSEKTLCEYRTAHDVTLWPIRVAAVEYHSRDLAAWGVPVGKDIRAAIRIRLETLGGIPFAALTADALTFYLRGADEIPRRIYEQVIGHGCRCVVQSAGRLVAWRDVLPADAIRQIGFDDEHALLPFGARSFQGYRLLHEYLAFPERALFFELSGLARGLGQCGDTQLDVFVLLDKEDLELEGRMDMSHFELFSTPVVNLFPKRADRVQLSDAHAEHHIVPDRTRPQDFEVYQVTDVTGHGIRTSDEQTFLPFFSAASMREERDGSGAYFSVSRVPRIKSKRETERGRRTSYGGSEVYVSLVDAAATPYDSNLKQLSIGTLCTNRDLPLQMPVGRGDSDFALDTSAPVASIRCVAGPTAPRPSFAEGDISWRAISHLTLNYLSISDGSADEGATALRDLMKLYSSAADPQTAKQIDGLHAVTTRPVTRRMTAKGPVAFARGLEVALEFDEREFEGFGAFLLGAVLERFLARYVSINSFTETVVSSLDRGEIMRWPARVGNKQLL